MFLSGDRPKSVFTSCNSIDRILRPIIGLTVSRHCSLPSTIRTTDSFQVFSVLSSISPPPDAWMYRTLWFVVNDVLCASNAPILLALNKPIRQVKEKIYENNIKQSSLGLLEKNRNKCEIHWKQRQSIATKRVVQEIIALFFNNLKEDLVCVMVLLVLKKNK